MLVQQVGYFGYLFWFLLIITSSLSYPIYNFIIHETRSGTLLEFSRLRNASLYRYHNNTSPITVILLTNNKRYQNFDDLKNLVSTDVKYIYDQRDEHTLRTPQVHVLIQPAHSTALPGIVKFMAPLKKMNLSEVANFIMTSVEIEKDIVSPNIHKTLCMPSQQMILMNTILGNYRAFTMYVVNWADIYANNSMNFSKSKQRNNGGDCGHLQLSPTIAKEILNPIRCELMFGPQIVDIDT